MGRVVEVRGLECKYDQKLVIDNVDFSMGQGQIIGLIGPSGAGKSTLIKILLGMEKASTGEVKVLDTEVPNLQLLDRIGYKAQSDALYETLTGFENLEFFGQIGGIYQQSLTFNLCKSCFI